MCLCNLKWLHLFSTFFDCCYAEYVSLFIQHFSRVPQNKKETTDTTYILKKTTNIK